MANKKTIRSIIFLLVGLAIFWAVYRNTSLEELSRQIGRFNIFWIMVSVALNIFSQLLRAHRWKLLFSPLKYNPKTCNLFFGYLILGFTNQVIPRGGEVARLALVNRTEKIPFSKLLGVALAERLTDFIVLMTIFVALIIWQLSNIKELLALPDVSLPEINLPQTLLIILGAIVFIVLMVIVFRKFNLLGRFGKKLNTLKEEIQEGFSSIFSIKNKLLYLVESLLIYGVWLLMSYVLFFAYPPTQDLSFKAAALTFGLATMAFLLPIQAGMGAWHFVVMKSLLLFGVAPEFGRVFSLVAHASTNLVYLVLGGMAFGIMPFIKKKNQKLEGKKN